MKTILVTGVGGFVGADVADLLFKEGYNVIGVYRNKLPKCSNVKLVKIDLSKEIEINYKADAIIHFAAQLVGDINAFIENNIIATRNLIQYAKINNIDRFVYISTNSVFGETSGIVTENSDIINPSEYGISKYICEKIVKYSSIKYKTIIRLPRMFGNNLDLSYCMNSGFLKIMLNMLEDKDVFCFNPELMYNNFMHTEDLANFLVKIIEEVDNNEVNLAAKYPIRFLELLNIMKKYLKSNSKIIIKETNTKTMCANVCIDKAIAMGYQPMDSEEVIKKVCLSVLKRWKRNSDLYV